MNRSLPAKTAWRAAADRKHLLYKAVTGDPLPTRLPSRSLFSVRARPYFGDREILYTRGRRKAADEQLTIEKWSEEWESDDNALKELQTLSKVPAADQIQCTCC